MEKMKIQEELVEDKESTMEEKYIERGGRGGDRALELPLSWGKFIIWAEWSYNTSIHAATGITPYKTTFGKKPPSIPQYLIGTSNIDVVDDFLTSREIVFAMLRKKLLKA